MFEDRTYENILAEMLSDIPGNINKSEGSLIYNACVKQALKLEDAYIDMANIYDNMLPDTQDEEHLIRYAKERGIEIKEATKAILKAVFQQEIEIGERFNIGDLNYIITEKISDYVYKIECETAGVIGNTQFGELEYIEYIDDYLGGEITEVITPGQDQEDTEVFRARVYATWTRKSFGGNRAAYKEYFNDIVGVGGVKVKRRNSDSEYVTAVIITSTYATPSDTFIEEVQDEIDPTQSAGEGDGYAPICHKVLVSGVASVSIDVGMTLTYDTGYTYEDISSYIESTIDDYFLELAQTWDDNDSLIVRIKHIESRMLAIDGVIDITNTTLNVLEENIILGENEIPVRGDINVV